MAGDYLYPEETVSAEPARFEKPLRTLIFIALLCVCGKLIWLFGISPFRPFTRIDINGYTGVSNDVIFNVTGIASGMSYFAAETRVIQNTLMDLGVFESVRVLKYFPSRLQIILEDRMAVAQALASIDDRTVPVLLDRQGVVFGIGRDGMAFSGMLPVISGLVIENPFPGMRLPGLFLPLFEELEKIMISAPELLGAISEIKVNRRLFGDYDITLYPVHNRIKVRLSGLNEDMLRYTLLMVDVLASNEAGIDTLDFRSGIASYTIGGTL
jgi:cell division protein FtsQ